MLKRLSLRSTTIKSQITEDVIENMKLQIKGQSRWEAIKAQAHYSNHIMSCTIYISILGFLAQPQRWAAELPKALPDTTR